MAVRFATPTPALYFRAPMCGGTTLDALAVEAGLSDGTTVGPGDHCCPRHVPQDVRDEHVCFAVVRHPLDWWAGLYCHARSWQGRPGPNAEPVKGCHEELIGPQPRLARSDESFGEFVERAAIAEVPGYCGRLFDVFTEGCLFVGRLEQLRRDAGLVLRACGAPKRALDVARTKPAARVALPEFRAECRLPRRVAEALLLAEADGSRRWGYPYVPEGLVA